MKNPPQVNGKLVLALRNWRKTKWLPVKATSTELKFKALSQLVATLATILDKPIKVEFRPNLPTCCFSPATGTIYINSSLSILSTLHEFSHHLHGESELEACKWSVHLFKAAFPKTFEKLKWDGHMLRK